MKRIAVLTVFAGCLAWSLTFAGQQQQGEQDGTRPQRETQQPTDQQFAEHTGHLWKQMAHNQIVKLEMAVLQAGRQPRRGGGQDSPERQEDLQPQQRQQERLQPGQPGQERQDRKQDTAIEASRERLWQRSAQVHQQIVALQLARAQQSQAGQAEQTQLQQRQGQPQQQRPQQQQRQPQEPGQQTDRQFQEQMQRLILRLGMLHQQAIAFDMADTLQSGKSLQSPRSDQREQQQEKQPQRQPRQP